MAAMATGGIIVRVAVAGVRGRQYLLILLRRRLIVHIKSHGNAVSEYGCDEPDEDATTQHEL